MLRAVARGTPGTLWRRIYSVPNPAAGADLTFPVPQHRAWQLLSVSVKFTASGSAGNRFPLLTLADNDGIALAQIGSPTAITAGLAPRVTWTPGLGQGSVVAATFAALALPEPWYMLPGESVQVSGHTDAGDTLTQIRVTVLELNTGDPDYIGSLEQGIRDHAEALFELTH